MSKALYLAPTYDKHGEQVPLLTLMRLTGNPVEASRSDGRPSASSGSGALDRSLRCERHLHRHCCTNYNCRPSIRGMSPSHRGSVFCGFWRRGRSLQIRGRRYKISSTPRAWGLCPKPPLVSSMLIFDDEEGAGQATVWIDE